MDRRAFLVGAAALPALPAAAAPKADLWDFWQPHDPASETTVSHDEYSAFLADHLVARDGINLLDYSRARAALPGLQEYIEKLTRTPVRALNKPEQLAYWINMYNAVTIHVVARNYPVDSIREISSGLLTPGPWELDVVVVEEQPLTLNDIEHRILRPIWGDARIHYAVNCASIGCPNLAMEAYTAANAESLLEAGAQAYVNHPRGAKVDQGELHVSSIYEWFKEDFGGDDQGVIAHLREYAEPGLREQLGSVEAIAGDDYDWSLNDSG